MGAEEEEVGLLVVERVLDIRREFGLERVAREGDDQEDDGQESPHVRGVAVLGPTRLVRSCSRHSMGIQGVDEAVDTEDAASPSARQRVHDFFFRHGADRPRRGYRAQVFT